VEIEEADFVSIFFISQWPSSYTCFPLILPPASHLDLLQVSNYLILPVWEHMG